MKLDTQLDSIFALTEKILQNNEMKILNYKDKQLIPEVPFINSILNKIFFLINKYITFPYKYLLLGARDFFKPFFVWSIISVLFMVVFSTFIPELNNRTQGFSSLILNIILIIPMFLVIFSVPTTYAFYGLDDNKIVNITNDLTHLNINNKITIEYIEKNLEIIYLRVIARYTAYKWIIHGCFILYQKI